MLQCVSNVGLEVHSSWHVSCDAEPNRRSNHRTAHMACQLLCAQGYAWAQQCYSSTQ